jgi:hypothetical protein
VLGHAVNQHVGGATHFEQWLLLVENILPPSHFVLYRVLFLNGQPVSCNRDWFIIGGPIFFFLPSFLSHTQRKCTLVLIVISFPGSIFLVLIVYFCYFLFYYSFICFQFNPSILICIYNFSIRSSTFDFFFFSFYLLSRFFGLSIWSFCFDFLVFSLAILSKNLWFSILSFKSNLCFFFPSNNNNYYNQ